MWVWGPPKMQICPGGNLLCTSHTACCVFYRDGRARDSSGKEQSSNCEQLRPTQHFLGNPCRDTEEGCVTAEAKKWYL